MTDYNCRNKRVTRGVTINCPEHGRQSGIDLGIDGEFEGLGCFECFKHLKAVNIRHNEEGQEIGQ